MSSQAELGAARWLALGAMLGLLASSLLAGAWHRDARGLSVTVLGAGRQASVLITSHHRHVLIGAGTNGSSFSNALADALPPIDNDVDVTLIDPNASLDVRDRARSLESRVIWTLPERGEPPVADTIERSFTIEFNAETRLQVNVTADGGWHVVLMSKAGIVIIAPDSHSVQSEPGLAVAVVTHAQEEVEIDVPLLISLPGTLTSPDQQVRVARPGSAVRLELGYDEIRFRAP